MPTKRLSDFTLQKLQPPSEGQIVYWDPVLKGFGIRISYNGTKSWTVLTRLHGKQIRVTLGSYPRIGLKRARELAYDVLDKADRGEDPRQSVGRNSRSDRGTIASVIDLFIERYARPKNRTWRDTRNLFARNVTPVWGHRQIDSITKKDVNLLLVEICERGSPLTSNRVHSAVRKFFNWCVEEDLLAASPVYGVRPKARETQRDRVVTDTELPKIWAACDEIGWPFGPLVQLLALTGQRRSEVAQMYWAELDLDQGMWSIPRERSKNDRANEVPLSAPALEIIKGLPRYDDLVFTVTGVTPVSGFPRAKRRLDEISGVTDWRFHDLRRTAATGMARMAVPPHVIEKVLNHSSGAVSGVAAIYNRYGYLDEKRAALDEWAQHVVQICGDKQLG